MHRAKNTPRRENRGWSLVSMAQNADLEQHRPGRAAWHESLCFLCGFSSSAEQTAAALAGLCGSAVESREREEEVEVGTEEE